LKLLEAMSDVDHPRDTGDFSLVLGGPLFQLLLRAHLSDDALKLVRQRILFISLFAWLPLLGLAALERHLSRGTTTVPFLMDLEVHVRFLVAIPLLIAAELVVHQRIRPVVQLFLERRLVPESKLKEFRAAIDSSIRLRNSVIAELVLIAFVYGVGVLLIWRHYVALDANTWYASPSSEGTKLSLAGMWYGYVSLPIFQFLWQVSRIKLDLLPAHPDRLGGLGFLSNTVYAFGLLLTAHGALLAGQLANRILYTGASLPEFKVEIATLVVFLLCVVVGPLLVFTPQLAQAKRTGNREYGTAAERYVRAFDTKWVRGEAPADEPFIGSADIQSLADLGNSLEVVRGMRIAPITRDGILRLAAAILIPIVPLALTMMPLEELMKLLLGMVF
jgi:hypothetical protein